jgi:serine/threonine protein kinase
MSAPRSSVLERIDQLCDRYEDARLARQRPRIDDYLREVPEAERSELFRELLKLDLHYRRQQRETPTEAEYCQYFPQYSDLIQAIFHEQLCPEGIPCKEIGLMPSPHELNPDQGRLERATPSTTVLYCWSPNGEPVMGYRLVRILGRGGLGEVWEARAPGGVSIALKRVPIHGHAGQRELEALELLKRVRHPHLLAIHGYWLLDEYLVIGLELAEESLGSLLHRRKQSGSLGLPQDEVLQYLTDAAEALDYLARPVHRVNSHAIRIQHRDVKPANLLLQGGAIKVADFGLAKALKDFAPELSFSMTPAYAPPEFFAGETAPTSDQYSLGVTYCELRTGRLPFVGTSTEIRDGHLHRQPDLTGLSDRERPIVLRVLDKNPVLRWAGSVKFIGELMRATPAAPAQSVGSQGSQEQPTPPPANDTSTYRGQPVTSGLLLVANDLVPIPLRRTDIRAAVTAGRAEVTVTQVFRNTHGRSLEAVYVFPCRRMRRCMVCGWSWMRRSLRESSGRKRKLGRRTKRRNRKDTGRPGWSRRRRTSSRLRWGTSCPTRRSASRSAICSPCRLRQASTALSFRWLCRPVTFWGRMRRRSL